MRVSGRYYWAIAGVIALALGLMVHAAHADKADAANEVVVHPVSVNAIDQPQPPTGAQADNQGSLPSSGLDRIELRAVSFDTAGNEPAVPAGLQQSEVSGPRLRIIQFKGPIQPEWLAKLKGVNGTRIINYIPDNAYLVRLDPAAEEKLRGLQGALGFIQWIGPYHPYYKVQRGLLNGGNQDAEALVNVRVSMVGGSDAGPTIKALGKFGLVQESYDVGNQKVAIMTVPTASIAGIANLSDVTWIEKKLAKRTLDEVQDLVLAGQTNGPGNGPSTTVGITNYLDFLFNTVSGGLNSFVDPNAYPIVDIADTGLDTGSTFTAHPAFHLLGDPDGPSRVAYVLPPWIAGDPLSQLGCNTRINENAFRHIEGEDIYGHGTLVASIISGYDTGTNLLNQQCLGLVTFSNTFIETVPGTDSWNIISCPTQQVNLTIPFSTGQTDVCGAAVITNVFVTILTNSCPTNITLTVLFSQVETNVFEEIRRDAQGFQLGMGVSPFGAIGTQRIFSQDVSLDTSGGGCQLTLNESVECLNNFPALVAFAYTGGARIENNSWSDIIDIQGLNGGEYTADSQSFDVGVRDALLVGASNSVPGPFPLNQELTVVFAVASGTSDAGSEGNVGGFADIRVTAPATAKNVISVGASVNPRLLTDPLGPNCEGQTNSLEMALFAAAGPTLDGRFKPEIVAPGSSIYGALSQQGLGGVASTNCSVDNLKPITPLINECTNPPCAGSEPIYSGLYICDSGSSYAAPAVSGAIQLLWWYFQNRMTDELGTPLLQPSPAMSKAYLCNSARYLPIINPQYGALDTLPSILQGMGELDLQTMFDQVPRVIRDESTRRAIDATLVTTNPVPQQTFFSQTGQSYQSSGQVFDATKPFRVTLAWTDAAGVPGASKELINDLDLEVTIGGQTYKGNVFSGPNSVPNVGSADRLNNMESVFLPAGQTGTWSVVVRAVNIAGQGVPNVGSSLGQDFALVVYNAASTNRSDVPNLSTNNSCGTAINITDDTFSFTNTLSTTGPNPYYKVHPSPSAAVGGAEEFFKLTNPTPGSLFTISTTGSTFDNVLSVWRVQVVPETVFVRGECGALIEVTSTNGGNNSSTVTFTADGSNDYYIVAEPHNGGPGGTLVLNVNASISSIVVTPTSLAFASEPIGLTSAVQTVTYQNNTTATPIEISSTTFAGSNAADFVIVSQSCVGGPVAPGANCSINVGFSPTALGPRSAELVITDDATGSPRLVPLTGNGTPAAPSLCLSLSGGALSFSSQLLTTTSAVQSITITNCGSAPLTITSVTPTGFGSNDFLITQSCTTNSPLGPNGVCTINVSFAPLASGTRVSTLVIADSAAGSPTTITLTGTGTALAPAICFGSSSLNFGNVTAGSTGSVQSITITNCGTAPLVINGLPITGANPGDFIISSTTCATVTTGQTCSVSLKFAPSANGPRSASLGIVDNASGSPQLLSLIGNGASDQPDASIGKTANVKKMVGRGIINTTGAAQEIKQTVRAGAKKPVKFYVNVQNIGTSPDNFNVQADAGSAGFTVHYFLGAVASESTDVTTDIESGAFSTSTLAPGASTSVPTMIRVEVLTDKTVVTKGQTQTFKLTFTSANDPTKVDAVNATVQVK